MKAIIIPYNADPYTKDYDEEYKVMEYNDLKALLSELPHPFSWFEIVKVLVGGRICQMYVDEVGKMYDTEVWRQCTNPIATELYNNPFDVIVGDVVLLADHNDPDTYLFSDEEAIAILDYLGS